MSANPTPEERMPKPRHYTDLTNAEIQEILRFRNMLDILPEAEEPK